MKADLFAEVQLSQPFFAAPIFAQLRATATRKANTYTAKSRLALDEGHLLDAVRADGRFVAIAQAFPGTYWSDVFRDLLRARARGLVSSVDADRWVLADHSIGPEQRETLP